MDWVVLVRCFERSCGVAGRRGVSVRSVLRSGVVLLFSGVVVLQSSFGVQLEQWPELICVSQAGVAVLSFNPGSPLPVNSD